MASTNSSICVSLFVLFQLYVYSSQYDTLQNSKEQIVESGDNFTVLCEGNNPLIWKWPEVEDLDDSGWTTITTVDVPPENPGYKYANKLFLQNATYPYTGFYKCFSKNVDSSDELLVNNIYLFVLDEEHLSVNSENVETVIVTQYDEAVIPCRPTSPDVNVQLTFINGEEVFLDTVKEDGILYSYNPHYGFITNNTQEVEMVLFACIFTRDLNNFEKVVIMDVEPKMRSVPKPILEKTTKKITAVGEMLVLKCLVWMPTYANITWITPSGPPDLKRMNISHLQKDFYNTLTIVQTLTINNVTLGDEGVYRCNVSDNQNHYSISSLNVTVDVFPNRPKIFSNYETIIEKGDNLTVTCQGNSPLIWEWPNVEDLSVSKWSTIITTDVPPKSPEYKYASRISLQNATYEYTGFYKCYSKDADPSDDSLVSSIYLFIKDEEHLSANSDEFEMVTVAQYSDAVLPCRPTSPDVDVQLTDAYGKRVSSCVINEKGIIYHYNPHYGFRTNNTQHMGHVLYSCIFTKGSKKFVKTIIMDVDSMVPSVPKPTVAKLTAEDTVVGETLTLKCEVKTPTDVSITWITPTGSPNYNRAVVSDRLEEPSDTGLVFARTLTINNATLEDGGIYRCKVSDNQNHSNFTTFSVTVYDYYTVLPV